MSSDLECEWCGIAGIIKLEDGSGLIEDVIEFADGPFHPDCHKEQNKLDEIRTAFKGLDYAQANVYWETIKDELR